MRQRHWFSILTILSIMVIVFTAGCGNGNQTANAAQGSGNGANASGNASKDAADKPANAAATNGASGGDKKDWPEVIRFGVLPGEEEGKLSRGNQQFVDDLGKALGIKTELYVGEDYTAVIEAMRTKKIDIASFGPFSYIIAAQRSGAVPFAVKAASKEAAFYHSLIVVPANSPAKSIADLKGKTFLFADPASTSGHLFPRMMMIKELGITNDQVDSYFSNVSFSGGHDKSILAIAKGQADGAGVCDSCIKRVVDAGLVKESDYKVIGTSDPIPGSPLAYRGDLPAGLVEKIKDFVFNYDKQNPEFFKDAKGSMTHYFPVTDADYQVVKDTAKALNMSPEELLK
ncbi:phosphonate ABC transporter substrate-binding protein [Paenibacillus sp. GCM10023250]|uniref:phosphonate ABC transporter substrate-binding protein n=1 Tax=Paenibacillus sp. GCM10023250 TaxID=3252648 RepID=UPI00361C2151